MYVYMCVCNVLSLCCVTNNNKEEKTKQNKTKQNKTKQEKEKERKKTCTIN